jgi:hypothetical protein
MSLSERGYDIGSAPGWGLLDECEDTGEGVTDVFKLIIEVLAVPCEPVLEGLEQVAREVGQVALGVAVALDGIESLDKEQLVAFGGQGEGALMEPRSGPCECV